MRGIVPDGYRECPACGLYTPREQCRCGASVASQTRAIDAAPLSRDAQTCTPVKSSVNTVKRKAPNQTESDYRDKHLSGLVAMYEALTLKMDNGHRYTPDWVVVRNGRIECHEVKGSYRLHSHQRARLAFDQARVEYSFFVFVWAEQINKHEWKVEAYNA